MDDNDVDDAIFNIPNQVKANVILSDVYTFEVSEMNLPCSNEQVCFTGDTNNLLENLIMQASCNFSGE